MAILKIAKMGHPVLRQRADAVDDPTAPDIRQLCQDMLETMHDAPGTGLAAPQVHVPKRVVIYLVSAARASLAGAEEVEVPLTVLINPEIEPLSQDVADDWEGCLSVPGLRGVVTRHVHIGVRATTLTGELFEREAKGFHARVIQHECDHLDGILYPQRMTDLSKLIFNSEERHWLRPASAEGVA